MQRIDVVVIGAGQAGLAMSRCLGDAGIAHVVLERAQTAERWRSELRPSLRLLTPNWMTRLPGWRYAGPDPDGFMTMPEVADLLDAYACSFDAPVIAESGVVGLRGSPGAFTVETRRETWLARAVVIATGHCDMPAVPPMAQALAPHVHQLTASDYRTPAALPPGGTLVVGGSASGVQIADELARAGRSVAISVGRHIRMPRRYRGRDIMFWLDRCGILNVRREELPDPEAAMAQPSLQLAGHPDHRDVGLIQLRERGVTLLGRACEIDGHRIWFADDLPRTSAAAERKLARLLQRIDRIEGRAGKSSESERAPLAASASGWIDLDATGITSIVWATGYVRQYPWLKLPVLDDRGEIVQRGGVAPIAGLYTLGQHFMRRRNSSFIDGVGEDARELARHIAGLLGARRRIAA
jgi:putative flavoprotein involved in K+ transport